MRSDAGRGACVEGRSRKAGESVDGDGVATDSDAATRGGGGVMDAAGEAIGCWRRGSRRVRGSVLILGLVATGCMVRGAGAWGMPTVCSLGNDVAADPRQRSSESCHTALSGVTAGGVGDGLLARRGMLCLRVGTAGLSGASGGKRCGRLAMSGEIVGGGGGEELGGQGGGDGRVPRRGWGAALGNRIRGMKVLTPFFKVAFVIAAAFRRLFMIRIAWLSMVTTTMKIMMLDMRTRLDDKQGEMLEDDEVLDEVKDGMRYLESNKRMMIDDENSPLSRALGRIQLSRSTGLSVEAAFKRLSDEADAQRVEHLETLQHFTGITTSVLDFIEGGGIPPSVEALYAWLEYRGIDTSVWGKGQAKQVSDLFHEIWGGESEPLTDLPQRVISVVKVRITCHDEGSEWALYETAQKFCKDGRSRVRNRPLAEKKKPGEEAVEAAIRGVSEELGSVLTADQLASISIQKDDIQQWDETNFSSSFPGLETLYKLWLVDVKIPGLERGVTGETFKSIENPDLTTGKVHTWVWKKFGSVEQAKELATMLKARYPPKPVAPSLTPGSE